MAKFRFIGQHTGDTDTINMNGVEFTGHKAVDVPDDQAERFRNSVEFEEVGETTAKSPAGQDKAPEPKPDAEVPADLTAPEPSEPERAREADAEIHELRAGAPEAKPDKPERKPRKRFKPKK